MKSEPIKRDGRKAVSFVLQGRRAPIALIGALSFIGGLLEATFLVIVTRVAFGISEGADRVELALGADATIRVTLVAMAGLLVARLALALSATWFSARLGAAAVGDIRSRISGAFLHTSWAFQHGQQAGSLQELLTRLGNEAAELVRSTSLMTIAVMNLLAMVSLAVVVDPFGALVILSMVVALGWAIRPLRNLVWRRSHDNNTVSMQFATVLNETSQLGLELHVFNVQEEAQERLHGVIRAAEVQYRRRAWAGGIVPHIYSVLAYAVLLGALAVVAAVATADLVTLGAVMLVMLRSLTYGQAVQTSLSSIASFGPGVLRLETELERFTDEVRTDEGEPLQRVGTLTVDDVTFSYVPGEPVLCDVSISVAPREIVGIVGPSGSGKSTLVQLILGLRDPDVGQVAADGRSIRSFAREDLARRITFVPQKPHLISATVAENIVFFRRHVTAEDIERAARQAYIHDEIMRLPEGYASQVGEGGGRLSGGQQQRLCIARALVEHPDVLILDEPTSALDVHSETQIRSSLVSLRERSTIIVIAHRLSTLDVCDRIVVLQDGRVRAFDTPARLEAGNRFYQEALKLSGMR